MNAPAISLQSSIRTHPARRLRPSARKLLLTVHIVSSVGMLGVVQTTLLLGIFALAADSPATAHTAYQFMNLADHTLLPATAITALVSGVILSVATPWGLLTHWWIVGKLVINVAVIVSGITLVDRWVNASVNDAGGASGALLVTSSSATLALLVAATVLSTYKPRRLTPWAARKRDS